MSTEETIPQMRDQIDSLTKANKEAQGANTKLAKENRNLSARDLFRDKGLDPKTATLFVGQHEGDITPEAVDAFAKEFGFAPVSTEGAGSEGEEGSVEEGESGPEAAPGSTELGKLARGGSRSGDGGAGGSTVETLTRAEYQALAATDPAAAKEAVRLGKVQISKDNVYSDQRPAPGNPYAPKVQ